MLECAEGWERAELRRQNGVDGDLNGRVEGGCLNWARVARWAAVKRGFTYRDRNGSAAQNYTALVSWAD